MLPPDYLKPCIAMMEELVDLYRSSIVLCTATQPALNSFFRKIRQVTELCPRVEEQFRFLKELHIRIWGRFLRMIWLEVCRKKSRRYAL